MTPESVIRRIHLITHTAALCLAASFVVVAVPNTMAESGVTNIINGTIVSSGGYTVGTNGTFNALIVTNAGVLRVTGNGIIGNSAVSTNNIGIVTGPGSLWTNSGAIYVGVTGSFNHLTIANGGTVMTTNIIIGDNASCGNSVTVNGGSLCVFNSIETGGGPFHFPSYGTNGGLYVGMGGSCNSLTLSNSGHVVNYQSYLGYNSSANSNSVLVTGAGSTWATSNLYVGYQGSFNQMTITNGGNVFVGWPSLIILLEGGTTAINIGYGSGANSNSLLVSGVGSVCSNQDNLVIGSGGNGNSMTIANGGQVFDDNATIGSGMSNWVAVTGSGAVWNNNGAISIGNQGIGNNLTIANGGVVINSSAFIGGPIPGYFESSDRGFASNNSVLVTGVGSAWSNNGTLYVGYASSGGGNGLTIASNGTVEATSVLVGYGTGAFDYVTVSGGNLTATNASDGTLRVRHGMLTLNSGTVVVNLLHLIDHTNSVMTFNAGLLASGGSAVTNDSTFRVGDGTDAATFQLLGGTHSFASGLFINTNATLTGTGSITGSITNAGLIVPGGSNAIGIITDTGNLTMLNIGAVTMDLAGTNAWLYDQLNLTGALAFNGTLTLSLLNGCTPQVGDLFDFFDFSSSSGSFSLINLPALSAGSFWDTSLLYSKGQVFVGFDITSGMTNVVLINGFTSNYPGACILGSNSGYNGLIVTNGGVLTSANGLIGNSAIASTNYALVTGAGSVWSNSGAFYVGVTGSFNQLGIANGGGVTNTTGYVGYDAIASNNTVLVTGAGSIWSSSGALYVGHSGSSNSLTIANGGTVTTTNAMVGFTSSTGNVITVNGGRLLATNADGGGVLEVRYGMLMFNSGTVTVDRLLLTNGIKSMFIFNGGTLNSGGTLVSGGSFVVGNTSTGATLNLIGGNHVFANGVTVNNSGPTSGLLVTNGAVAQCLGSTTLGNTGSSSNNVMLVTGAGSVWSNCAYSYLYVGCSGAGNQLTIANSGTVFGSFARIGYNPSASNNTVLVSDSGSVWNNSRDLLVGYCSSFNQMTIANSGKVSNTEGYIGYQVGIHDNAVLVTGAGSLWDNSSLIVGFFGSSNQLTIANGGAVNDTAGCIGDHGVWNAATVSGAGSVWSNSADLRVGNGSSYGNNSSFNQLMVSNGGTVFSANGYVGYGSVAGNNMATVSGAGSLWRNSAQLYVGYIGSSNQLTISNGGQVASANSVVGYHAFSSNNTVLVTGVGSLWSNSGNLIVGATGAFNSLTITNGGVVLNANGWVGSTASASNNSVLVTGAGSLWSNAGVLAIGQGGSGNQVTLASGGQIDATVLSNFSGSVFSMSGGNAIFTKVYNAGTISQSGGLFNPIFFDNTGFLHLANGTNTATVFLNEASGTVWQTGGEQNASYATNFGVWTIATGAVVNVTNFINQAGGQLIGAGGAINGSIINGGTLSFGSSPIAFTVSSNVTLLSGATTLMNVNDPGAGWQNYLSLGGLFTANGTLTVSLQPGYTPKDDSVFDLFSYGSVAGGFDQTNLPTGRGWIWDSSHLLADPADSLSGSIIFDQLSGPTNIVDGVVTNAFGVYTLGDDTGWNWLIITNGGTLINTSGIVGNQATANFNTAVVTGPGSLWSNSGSLVVGSTGSFNWLTVTNGGTVLATDAYVGYAANASNNWVYVAGAGSIWSNTGVLTLGVGGSSNGVTLANGGRIYAGMLSNFSGSIFSIVGGNACFAAVHNAGTVSQSGGLFDPVFFDNSGILQLTNGTNAPVTFLNQASGTVQQNGGEQDVNSATNFGVWTISGGVANFTNYGIANHGLLTVSGGTVRGSLTIGDAGFFNQLGGTNAATTFLNQASGTVQQSGGKQDVNSATNFGVWTISGGVANFANCVITNQGILTVSGGTVRGSLTIGDTGFFNQLSGTNAATTFLNQAAGTVQQSGGKQDVNSATNFGVWTISGGVANFTHFVSENQGALTVAGGVLNGSLTIGNTGSFNQLTIINGSVASDSTGVVGNSTLSSNNSALVTGEGSLWSNSTILIVGNDGSFNQLTITNSGTVFSAYGYVGNNVGAGNNAVLVTGSGSVWSNSGQFYIGRSGSGNSLTIANGASVFGNYGGNIGNGFAASNNSLVVTDPGSTLNVGGFFTIGMNAAGQHVTITNGGRILSRTTFAGFSAGNNTFAISGAGSAWLESNAFRLGASFGSSKNTLTINNGGLLVDSVGEIGGGGGNNIALITDPGSVWSNQNMLSIGWASGGNRMIVTNQAHVFSASAAFGSSSGGWGNEALITGTNSLWFVGGQITLGSLDGNNAIQVSAGATLVSSGAVVGVYSDAGYNRNNSVSITGSGSVWTNSGVFDLGVAASFNHFVVSNGARAYHASVIIGDSATAASNTTVISSTGSVLSSSGPLTIGNAGSGNGLTIVNGGQVINADAYVGCNASAGNNSVLVTGDGSVWTNTGVLTIGSGLGNSVTLANGGRIYASVLSNNNGNIFTMEGGSAYFPRVANAGVFNLRGGWFGLASFDNTGLFEVWNSLTVGAGAGLTNRGGGSVRLVSNATVNVSGNLVITNATLEFAGASTGSTPFLPGVTFQNGTGVKWAGYGGSFGNHTITGNLNLDLPSGSGLMRGIVDNASLSIGGGNGLLYVGSNNLVSLTLTNGAQVFDNIGYIGFDAASSNNSVLVDGLGSIWSNSDSLFVGYHGPLAALTLTDGGTVSATNIVVGYDGSSTGNVVTVSGGNLFATNAVGSGTLDIRRGTLTLNSGTVTVNRLFATNFASSVVNINGGELNVGELHARQLVTINDGMLTLADSFVNLPEATLQLNGGNMIVPGSVFNQGAFVQTGGIFDPAFYDNTGSWLLTGGTNVDVVFLNEATGVMLQSGGEHNVNVATNLGVWTLSGGVANITNLFIESDGVFTNSGGALVSTNTSGLGVIDVRNGTLTLNSGTVTVNQLIATNFANSVVNFNGGSLNSGGGAVNNSSIFRVGNAVSAATLHLLGGTHTFANSLFINTNSWLTGTGAITGVITNAGSIAPGDSPGILTVSGDLTLLTNSLLLMELAGTNDGLYDQINLDGAFTFGGTFTLSLLDGFTVSAGNRFDLFDFSNSSGFFSATNLPSLSAGLLWDTSLLYSTGEIEVDSEPPVITTSSPLPSGMVGMAYSQTLAVSGGATTYTWSLAAGSLPSGLSLSSAGVISGTPDVAITAGFTVQVMGNDGQFSTKIFGLTIDPPPPAMTNTIDGVTVNYTGTYMVGTYGSFNAQIMTNAGVLNVTGSSSIGYSAASSNNYAVVTGAGSLWNNNDDLYVGDAGSFNRLTIDSGGQVNCCRASVGNSATASSNMVLVTDPGSVWSCSGFLYLGCSGSGNSLTIANGGLVSDYNGYVGSGSPGTSNIITVSGIGSVWNNDGNLFVGYDSSGNRLIITNGGQVFVSGDFWSNNNNIGCNSGASNNSVLVTGSGSVWSNRVFLCVGLYGSANSLTIADGGQVLSAGAEVGDWAGANNNSVLVTGTGSVWNSSDYLAVGDRSGVGNSLTIAGGGLVLDTIGYVGYGRDGGADNNVVLVSDPGSVWSNSGALVIGGNASGNILTVTNGGRVFSTEAEIGYSPGASNNAMVVAGAGSVWNNSSNLFVGYLGSGNSLTITGGGSVSDYSAWISSWAAGNNSVVVSGVGSVWTNSGLLSSGSSGDYNTLTIGNGGRVFSSFGVIGGDDFFGYNDGPSTGNFTSVLVTDAGSLWSNSGSLYVGYYGSSNTLTVANSGMVLASNVVIGFNTFTGNLVTVSSATLIVTNTAANGLLEVRHGTLSLNSSTVTVNQFVATNFASSVVNFNGGMLNSGSSAFNNGSIFQVGDGTSAATLHLLGGTHSFADGLFINTNSWLTGTGAITGGITNAGTIAPGNSPGILNVSGDLTLLTNSLLMMELAGTNDGFYDQINVSGALAFDGTITLSLLDGFTVSAGNRFDLFDFSSSSGAFSLTNLPGLDALMYWDTSALYTSGEIEADWMTGSLQVTLAPTDAVSASAQWQVDGGAWQNSGDTVSDLVIGDHTLAFKDVEGWIKPTNRVVQVDFGETTVTNLNYKLTPVLLATASRKTHSAAGAINLTLNLNPVVNPTVEPR
ncbi:MAG: hypothetical protein WA117_20850, partial [Verrucomicrobiia bacterium]